MKDFIIPHPWKIIEDRFDPDRQRVSESLFSIGNGQMGQRANHEEQYSGSSLQGSYLAGIYYPDRTRVGWWKNGYPAYFAKVLNSPSWTDVDIALDGENLDLASNPLESFRRELDMQNGILSRNFVVKVGATKCQISAVRLCHHLHKDLGILRYRIEILDGPNCKLLIETGIDGDVRNEDSNYGEMFWKDHQTTLIEEGAQLQCTTHKTNFKAAFTASTSVLVDGIPLAARAGIVQEKKVKQCFEIMIAQGMVVDLEKTVVINTSFSNPDTNLLSHGKARLKELSAIGIQKLIHLHSQAWREKWKESDVVIEGDIKAQQGIRFNIFHLHQTYHGEDPRLNIGPKGFTGEKYGGSTYWDTEAYCLPFFQATASPEVAINLLYYRYRHLSKAIENASKLGFGGGAALYPMVTINGEECHNEWEITFEEIHRNGAIAYAIYDHTRYTNDQSYLYGPGVEVLVAIARFWRQRVHYAKPKEAFVIHGVTGPNEYENNVNNNWYTNYIASWCLQYATTTVKAVFGQNKERAQELIDELGLSLVESDDWMQVAQRMYLPEDKELGIFLQQEGFLDKELCSAASIPAEELPIHEHWSWDRILRSCYIKQADVLQGLYFFEDHFELDTIKRNFDFYEPMTVHESSLSPCVHAILASRLDKPEKAYNMYLRTARLDLDDYNNDTQDGLHITSMAGTWLAIVKGFAGLDIYQNHLRITPRCPKEWTSFSFRLRFRGRLLDISISRQEVRCKLVGVQLDIYIDGNKCTIIDSLRYAIN